ncbi:MAG: hypothetical protein A2V77_10230 [Anaeromyxobacter sp. RBG_16_69_14]|nr:MAG: hypothetical protein A2V77_10230 [Anaeromyxobacter sp. RBG_16_69_14]
MVSAAVRFRRTSSRRSASAGNGLRLLALGAALVASFTGALARAEPAGTRTTVSADAFARAAPDGAMLVTGVLRRRGVEDGDSALLRGRYLEFGASVGVNPAYSQAAARVEWVPLAPLQLRVQYDLYGFFGANGALLRFPSASSRFGAPEIDAAGGSEESGLGHRLLLSPVLRARVGPIVMRSQTDLAWFALSSSAGWFYEWEYDTLVARRDLVVSNRSTLLFEIWRGTGEATLLAGPGYEVTHATRANITRQRAEGVLFWSPTDELGFLARPRLFAMAGVNVVDRNRRGDPFAVVGLGADLDL